MSLAISTISDGLIIMKISESNIQNQEPKKTALLKKGYLVTTIIKRLSRMVEKNLLVKEEARSRYKAFLIP